MYNVLFTVKSVTAWVEFYYYFYVTCYVLIIVVQRTAGEAKSSDLMEELAHAVASYGPMEMGRQLYYARLIKHKHFFVLVSKQSDTVLNQGHLVARYIKEAILDDDDSYKKLLLFFKKESTMSKVYSIVHEISKYILCFIIMFSLIHLEKILGEQW